MNRPTHFHLLQLGPLLIPSPHLCRLPLPQHTNHLADVRLRQPPSRLASAQREEAFGGLFGPFLGLLDVGWRRRRKHRALATYLAVRACRRCRCLLFAASLTLAKVQAIFARIGAPARTGNGSLGDDRIQAGYGLTRGNGPELCPICIGSRRWGDVEAFVSDRLSSPERVSRSAPAPDL
jgi:hypothetical protein